MRVDHSSDPSLVEKSREITSLSRDGNDFFSADNSRKNLTHNLSAINIDQSLRSDEFFSATSSFDVVKLPSTSDFNLDKYSEEAQKLIRSCSPMRTHWQLSSLWLCREENVISWEKFSKRENGKLKMKIECRILIHEKKNFSFGAWNENVEEFYFQVMSFPQPSFPLLNFPQQLHFFLSFSVIIEFSRSSRAFQQLPKLFASQLAGTFSPYQCWKFPTISPPQKESISHYFFAELFFFVLFFILSFNYLLSINQQNVINEPYD